MKILEFLKKLLTKDKSPGESGVIDFKFVKPKRKIHTIVLHHSASDHDNHDDISVMKRWHLERGYVDVGYHYFIKRNGEIQAGRSLEMTPAAQKNKNSGTLPICLHGHKRFTSAQFNSMYMICDVINKQYNYELFIKGHKELMPTECPNYDYKTILNLDSNSKMRNEKK